MGIIKLLAFVLAGALLLSLYPMNAGSQPVKKDETAVERLYELRKVDWKKLDEDLKTSPNFVLGCGEYFVQVSTRLGPYLVFFPNTAVAPQVSSMFQKNPGRSYYLNFTRVFIRDSASVPYALVVERDGTTHGVDVFLNWNDYQKAHCLNKNRQSDF